MQDNIRATTRKHLKKQSVVKPRSTSSGFRRLVSKKPVISPVKSPYDGQSVEFEKFGLTPAILRAIGELGYKRPTKIQDATIADLLGKRDLLGCAQTGTGKTAAFALPLLEMLGGAKHDKSAIRALIIAPTRELAAQIAENIVAFSKYLEVRTGVIYGGVSMDKQEKMLRETPDILVATPGRLQDLIRQGVVRLSEVEYLVLDEADQLLDMGFLPDIKRIVSGLPVNRQSLMFSATMPPAIKKLACKILQKPLVVMTAPESSTATSIEQKVYHVERTDKKKLLLHVLDDPETFKVLVFTRTKRGADRLSDFLKKNKITAEAMHGNKSQNARIRILKLFRDNKTRVLVASDVAARGIDIDDITHVVNFDLPKLAELYVHRIGRTGRASNRGVAMSFCDKEEKALLENIEKTTKKPLAIVGEHPFKKQIG